VAPGTSKAFPELAFTKIAVLFKASELFTGIIVNSWLRVFGSNFLYLKTPYKAIASDPLELVLIQ